MALDGITTAAIVTELKEKLIGGRIDKVHQPLADEIRFSVRAIGANYKVLASANSGHPRMHITENTRENPMTAPLFCMVLRKHIAGGKIIDICQPNFERIIIIKVESANEMGDMTVKNLILEIMGKHSNLILTDENNKILEESVSQSISQAIIKEMNYLFQAQDRQEEDRYKKLDHLIRQQQTYRKESARSAPIRKLRKLFEM